MSALNVSVYSQEGKSVGARDLAPEVFGLAVKPTVLQAAVLAQRANLRRPIAHTKTRGEVRGGGKKPWRQKGTGRARHGSIRSPIWVGGGVTFGPRRERNFSVKLNRKVRNLALRMSLSDKVAAGKFVALDQLTLPEYKTRVVARMLAALPVAAAKPLLVLAVRDEKVSRSARNIPGVRTTNAASLSVVDILDAGMVVAPVSAIEAMERILKPKR